MLLDQRIDALLLPARPSRTRPAVDFADLQDLVVHVPDTDMGAFGGEAFRDGKPMPCAAPV